jgi:hypothetical protein
MQLAGNSAGMTRRMAVAGGPSNGAMPRAYPLATR